MDDALLSGTDPDVLRLYVRVLDELRSRGVVRSHNIPTGDYGELLVARHFGVPLEANSQLGYDLRIGKDRVQVKARRLAKGSSPAGFSALRNLAGDPAEFDVLIALTFDHWYGVLDAWWIPYAVVVKYAKPSKRLLADRLPLIRGDICAEEGVRQLKISAT